MISAATGTVEKLNHVDFVKDTLPSSSQTWQWTTTPV